MYRPPVNLGPPDLLPHRERLYLSPANPATADALLTIFYRLGLIVEEPHEGVLLIQLQADHVEQLADSLSGELTAEQLRETKCRLSDAGHAPALAELMRSQTLETFAASLRYHWLHNLLRQRSLVTFFQPIVPCGSPRQVFAYECLVRGRHAHGELIYPNKLYDAARATGMLPQLDREARRTAIETSAQRRLDTFSSTSIPVRWMTRCKAWTTRWRPRDNREFAPTDLCSKWWRATRSKTSII